MSNQPSGDIYDRLNEALRQLAIKSFGENTPYYIDEHGAVLRAGMFLPGFKCPHVAGLCDGSCWRMMSDELLKECGATTTVAVQAPVPHYIVQLGLRVVRSYHVSSNDAPSPQRALGIAHKRFLEDAGDYSEVSAQIEDESVYDETGFCLLGDDAGDEEDSCDMSPLPLADEGGDISNE